MGGADGQAIAARVTEAGGDGVNMPPRPADGAAGADREALGAADAEGGVDDSREHEKRLAMGVGRWQDVFYDPLGKIFMNCVFSAGS